jgi:excisionase family DNA binding protein
LKEKGTNDDELIPVSEVAKMLNLSEKSVRAIIKRGDLPAFRPTHRSTRVRRGDIYTFLANWRVKPAPAKQKEGR